MWHAMMAGRTIDTIRFAKDVHASICDLIVAASQQAIDDDDDEP